MIFIIGIPSVTWYRAESKTSEKRCFSYRSAFILTLTTLFKHGIVHAITDYL